MAVETEVPPYIPDVGLVQEMLSDVAGKNMPLHHEQLGFMLITLAVTDVQKWHLKMFKKYLEQENLKVRTDHQGTIYWKR